VAIVNEIQKQKNKVVTAQIGDPKTEKNTKENTKKEDHYNSRNLIRAYPSFPHSPNLMYGPYWALGILTSTNYLLKVKPTDYRTSALPKQYLYIVCNKALYNKYLAEQPVDPYSILLSHRITNLPPPSSLMPICLLNVV
jgi:hypothetical protein